MFLFPVRRLHNRPLRSLLPPLLVAVAVLAAACSSTAVEEVTEQPESGPGESTERTVEPSESAENSAENSAALPVRDGPARETTGDVPHIQIDAVLDPEVGAELRRRAFSLPGVVERESTVSLPGAQSLWLADDVALARPEIILSGREFGHIHPDGSLHLLLPLDRASEVAETKWGESHPWATRDGFWGGLVMVFTPESLADVDISMQLIVDAYNFATGSELDPADFA